MSARQVLYFAHAINCYNTPYEQAALKLIAFKFPGAKIVNPNSPEHQEAYLAWRAASKDRDNHRGMNYFYDEVLPACTGSVAMPFLDERFGLGVAGELKNTLESGKPVWGMFLNRPPTPENLAAWVADPLNAMWSIRQLGDAERGLFLSFSKDEGNALVLGHQETRLRSWLVYNVTQRPYETAHLATMPVPPGFYPEEKK